MLTTTIRTRDMILKDLHKAILAEYKLENYILSSHIVQSECITDQKSKITMRLSGDSLKLFREYVDGVMIKYLAVGADLMLLRLYTNGNTFIDLLEKRSSTEDTYCDEELSRCCNARILEVNNVYRCQHCNRRIFNKE
jgi:DNA-directed RNA polymerase subunit RPC12/RpoP